MRCADCQWWDRANAWGESKSKAACRVRAPSIRADRMACDVSAVWPSTNADDWCGQFSLREK